MSHAEEQLKKLGLSLPAVGAPVAKYVPFVVSGNLVYISGQIPRDDKGIAFQGKVGVDFTVEQGAVAAQNCALQIISVLKQACNGDLSRVVRCVKLGGFVNCPPDFTDHPAVVNGASNLIVDVFGEDGMHSRAAVGMGSLPAGVAVEVEAIFEIKA